MEKLKVIHQHSLNNRREIESSEHCGCFYCLEIFSPEIIGEDDWNPKGQSAEKQTLFCPKCGIDAVIGSASGFPVTIDLLKVLNENFFKTTINVPSSSEPEIIQI